MKLFSFPIFFQLLIVQFFVFSNWISTEKIGSIRDVILSMSTATVTAMNGSCASCICMILLKQNVLGVSCSQNETCLLFYNYSLPYSLDSRPNSSFHFLVLPAEQEYSTYVSAKTTETGEF